MEHSRARWTAAALQIILVCSAASASEGELRSLVRGISQTALRAGIETVAVQDLARGETTSFEAGRRMTEKLCALLAAEGVVQVKRIASTAAQAAPGGGGAPGENAAQAILVGSFTEKGDAADLEIRLVREPGAQALDSRKLRIDRYSEDDGLVLFVPSAAITAADVVQELFGMNRTAADAGPAPKAARGEVNIPDDLREAPNEDSCSGAEERLGKMQQDIVDLKARYWARYLKSHGKRLDELSPRPELLMPEAGLREWFQYLLEERAKNPGPPLTSPEIRRFVETDRESMDIHRLCLAGRPKPPARAARAPGAAKPRAGRPGKAGARIILAELLVP